MANPICWYDFTMPRDDDALLDTLRKWLQEHCRKWSFQGEKGEITGYRHFQGRFVLKDKKRIATVIASSAFRWHLSPTRTETIGKLDPMSYCTKDETREDGPWTDVSESLPPDMLSPVLREWQKILVSKLDEKAENRKIFYAEDLSGKHGKTWLCRWLLCHRGALLVPYNSNVEMMANCIGSAGTRKIYLFDIPRAEINKNLWRKLVAFAESLKNGIITETRYHFRQTVIPSPHVVIFCNFELDKSWLSVDRWSKISLYSDCEF